MTTGVSDQGVRARAVDPLRGPGDCEVDATLGGVSADARDTAYLDRERAGRAGAERHDDSATA